MAEREREKQTGEKDLGYKADHLRHLTCIAHLPFLSERQDARLKKANIICYSENDDKHFSFPVVDIESKRLH